jgi:hypothetical protein
MQQIVQMKIEQLIVQFLFKKKKVKLQSIGEFTFLSESSTEVSDDDTFYFPENSIQFTFNPKATEDDDLIQYIMLQTGKIKPLAASDLESYIVLSKQFLNIGKSLFLSDLGSIQKNQNNEYLFTQGLSVPIKLDINSPQKVDTNQNEKVISFASPVRKKSNKIFILPVAILIMIIFSISVFYYFISNRNNTQINNLTPVIDSASYNDSINLVSNDSKIKNINSKININKKDSAHFSNPDSLNLSSDSGATKKSDTINNIQ